MFKKITALSLSLILALTAALSFSSAPAMAANPTLGTATWDGVPYAFRYITDDGNVTPVAFGSYGNNYRIRYEYDTQAQYRLGVSSYAGKYLTGYCLVQVFTSFEPVSTVTVSNESYGFEIQSQSGEGWSTTGVTNATETAVSVLLYLDNFYVPEDATSNLYFGSSIKAFWSGLFTGYNNAIYSASVTSATPNNVLQVTDQPIGDLSSVIAGSINSSSSIQQILTLLTSISNNTALLQSVLNKMDNISGVLANIYSQLQQGNNSLLKLGWALAGIDIQAADGNTVSQAVYDRWVDIIKSALDDQAPDTSEQESQLADREEQLAQKEELESEAFDFSNNNISTIDWNINVPDQIAGAALVIMAMVSDIWNQLGILQFAVTAACTVGLVTIILGVVNRFSSIKSRDSRRSAGADKSPGNENKTN